MATEVDDLFHPAQLVAQEDQLIDDPEEVNPVVSGNTRF